MVCEVRAVFIYCCILILAGPSQIHGDGKQARKPQHSAVALVTSQERQRKLEQAKQMIAGGSQRSAVVLLRDFLLEEPDSADARLLLGTALALIPEPSQALQELQRAVELRPAFAPAYFTLGTALARFTDLDGAKLAFEKVLEIDPRFAEAHVSLALVLAQRKEFAAARKHLSRANELQKGAPAAANTHYLLAKVLIEQNQHQEALQEFDVAIKLSPANAEAYLSRGLLKKKLLDDEGALRSFKRAVDLAPENPVAQHHLGLGYLRSGKVSIAVTHLRKASKLRPGERSYLYQLCRALQRAGQIEEATECEHQLLAVVKTRLTADSDMTAGKLNNEGVELEKSEKLVDALEKYRRATELDPFNTVFKRNLALVLCRLGQWEEAIAELKGLIKTDPEDVQASRALYIAIENVRALRKANSVSGSVDSRFEPR